MMFSMIGAAIALAAPMLVRWGGRWIYAALLLCGSSGLLIAGMREISRAGQHGSPGDGIGLAILVMSVALLLGCLLLGVLIRALVVGMQRRPRRNATPDDPRDW